MRPDETQRIRDIDRTERTRVGYTYEGRALVRTDVEWDSGPWRDGNGEHSFANIIRGADESLALGGAAFGAFDEGHLVGIAVLPFANISPDPQDASLADGITEELIFTLSKISELKVIAKTSVMRYRGAEESVTEIGPELGVNTIIEGSVRKTGKQIRTTVQLIDVDTQEHMWAEAYNGELDDLLGVQCQIAKQGRRRAPLPPPSDRAGGDREEADGEPRRPTRLPGSRRKTAFRRAFASPIRTSSTMPEPRFESQV